MTEVLHGLDLKLSPGLTGLLGPNGAGKTTLLRTLATVVPPWSGQVRLAGEDANVPSALGRVRRQLGYLPQRFGYPAQFTVSEFVRYSAWLRGVDRSDIETAAREAVAAAGLADHRRVRMRRLSGGMRQRAGIAATIVGDPRLVVLDEPTVGLDPMQRIEFRELLRDIVRRLEACVLLSTHLVEDIAACCDHVSVLAAGRIQFSGSVTDFAARAKPDAPGASDLERSYSTVLAGEEARA